MLHDDVFAIWGHRRQEIQVFLQHINNQQKEIQFYTMEEEEGGSLPFLDVTSTEGNKWQLANICLLEAYSYQHVQVSTFPFQSSP